MDFTEKELMTLLSLRVLQTLKWHGTINIHDKDTPK